MNKHTTQFFVFLILTFVISPLSYSQWVTLNSGTSQGINSVFFPHTDSMHIGFAVGKQGTIIKTTNTGNTWTIQPTGINDELMAVYFLDANKGFAAGYNSRFLVTTNGGMNWTSNSIGQTYICTGITFLNDSIGYMCGIGGSPMYKTTNGGATWFGQYSGITVGLYALSFVNVNVGFACGNGGKIFKTNNGGTTWSQIHSETNDDIFLGAHFRNENVGYVVGDYGKVLKTTDGGTSWSTTSLFDALLHSVTFSTDSIGYAVGTPGFIFKTTNTGTSWEMQNSGSSAALFTITFTKVDSLVTYYVSGSQGTLLRSSEIIPTSVTMTENNFPSEISLFQNHPNPFNPLTVIRYSLIVNSIVSLKVFDVLGREVATLIQNEEMDEGEHEVEFDAMNLPSGVYFYRIEITGESEVFVDVKKLVLVK